MIPENDKQVVTDLVAATDDRPLRAAAATVGQMREAELQDRFRQLQRARAARTPREVLRQQAELDSLELDEAAYQLASQATTEGNLAEAVRWYRIAAVNDFADAPLRLATVLDALSARPDMREERGLVTEAATWYLAAFLAGDLEGRDPLDGLIARLDEPADASAPADDDPCPHPCLLGGVKNVAQLPPADAVAHCSLCRPCKAELIKLRPLMGVLRDQPATATADAHDQTPDSDTGPQRPSSDHSTALHPEPSDPAQTGRSSGLSTSAKKG